MVAMAPEGRSVTVQELQTEVSNSPPLVVMKKEQARQLGELLCETSEGLVPPPIRFHAKAPVRESSKQFLRVRVAFLAVGPYEQKVGWDLPADPGLA